jgi:hypothetical protein
LNEKNEIACTGKGNLRVFTPEEMRRFKIMEEQYLDSFESQVFGK